MVLKALGLKKKAEEPQFRAPGTPEEMHRLDPERGREQLEAERHEEVDKASKNAYRRVAAATGSHGLPLTPRPFRDKFDGENDSKYKSLKEEHDEREEQRFNSWQNAKVARVEKGLPSSVAGRRKTRRRKSRRRR